MILTMILIIVVEVIIKIIKMMMIDEERDLGNETVNEGDKGKNLFPKLAKAASTSQLQCFPHHHHYQESFT